MKFSLWTHKHKLQEKNMKMNLKCYRDDSHDDNCQVIIAIMALIDC